MSFLRADKSKQNDTKLEECGWLSGLVVGLAMAGKMTHQAKTYIAGLDGKLISSDFGLDSSDIDVLKSNVWSGDDPHLKVSGGEVYFQPEEIPGVDPEELYAEGKELVKEARRSSFQKRNELEKQIEGIEAQLRVLDPMKAYWLRDRAYGIASDWKLDL